MGKVREDVGRGVGKRWGRCGNVCWGVRGGVMCGRRCGKFWGRCGEVCWGMGKVR